MKICIDGFSANKLCGTGLYSYTYELLDNLFQIYPQPQYDIIWDDPSVSTPFEKYSRMSYTELPLNRRKSDYYLLEEHIKNNKIKLFHSPNNGFSIPKDKVCSYIITVQDLLPVRFKNYADSKYLEKFMSVFPDVIKKCDKIIALSQYIKNDLVYYFGASPDMVEVIYPGCGEQFHPIEHGDCEAFLKDSLNIESGYVLFAGSLHARKNLPLLMKAFKKVLMEPGDLKLVIAGKNDGKREDYYRKLRSFAVQLGIESSIIFTGAVDYRNMPYLYSGAGCTVNLSQYEGFPLSAIEAMACGTPVICSSSSSFKEAVGDSALNVDYDEDIVKNYILKTIYDKCYRDSIIEKGLQKSMEYRWESSVKKLVNVYESIA